MNEIYIYVSLTLLGLVFGSFAGATVWRLRARQLKEDAAEGYDVDKAELKKLNKVSNNKLKDDRSVCLHCGHNLQWFDLIPLISWLSIGGRCRYCKQSIGKLEPLIEIGVAAFFALSYAFWPADLNSWVEIVQLGLWLLAGVGLAILFAYDAKWFLLPDVVMWPVVALAAIFAGLEVYQAEETVQKAVSVAGAITIFSGLYLAIYLFSRWKNGVNGTWVGFGDVKLGLALALLMADWSLAFLALFMANLIGCLLVVPGLISGKMSRGTHVPFGPLMIVGFIIAALWGSQLIAGYFSLLSSLVLAI
jgi:prepilin signal peptidase PulO-like enzyme (type II secretory pathway)